jgi:hypothetical protein
MMLYANEAGRDCERSRTDSNLFDSAEGGRGFNTRKDPRGSRGEVSRKGGKPAVSMLSLVEQAAGASRGVEIETVPNNLAMIYPCYSNFFVEQLIKFGG